MLPLEAGAGVNGLSGKKSFLGAEFNPIEIAAYHGKYDMVRLLINAGAEADIKENKFKKAIELAEEKGYDHISNLLKEQAALSQFRADIILV